jgi:hypothetical protein
MTGISYKSAWPDQISQPQQTMKMANSDMVIHPACGHFVYNKNTASGKHPRFPILGPVSPGKDLSLFFCLFPFHQYTDWRGTTICGPGVHDLPIFPFRADIVPARAV